MKNSEAAYILKNAAFLAGERKVKKVQKAVEIAVNVLEKTQWIPVKTRPMDDEERKYYEETFGLLEDDEAVMFDCKMPQAGQEVWVCSKCGNVWQDTCQIDEGIYLEENGDWLDIVAWMPYIRPEPWRGDSDDKG